MVKQYILTGTLTDERTVKLDESIPALAANGKVRVVVEPLTGVQTRPLLDVLAEIHDDQRARGYKPRTREEVDAYIRAERESWDD